MIICEELEQRCQHFEKDVHVSEIKCSKIRAGQGLDHSDGAGASDLTAVKMITKPRTGGTLLTQGEDGKWRFVNITSSEFVLLPTSTGARLHSAAHLQFVKTNADGKWIFKAVTDVPVWSLILNMGHPSRGEHQGPFIEEALRFARGEGCPEAQPSGLMDEKVAAWPGLMQAQRDAAAAAAARAAKDAREKEARKKKREEKRQEKAEARAAKALAREAAKVGAPSLTLPSRFPALLGL